MDLSEQVLRFWFGDSLESPEAVQKRAKLWFAPDLDFDRQIERAFASLPGRAREGALDAWEGEPRSALALVLVLDQFPRNLFRGSAAAFEFDAQALDVALRAVERGLDEALHPLEATFLYLPFEHAEDEALQDRCVALFRNLLERAPAPLNAQFVQFLAYAERHQAVIARFGRFPHRNAVLGRPSSAEEKAYLKEGGESF